MKYITIHKFYFAFVIVLILMIGCNRIPNTLIYGDGSSYCAFTSLLKQDSIYYLAFREGKSHVSEGDYGVIRILSSVDGYKWSVLQTLKLDSLDLRDPNLSITPDGRLLLICGARYKTKHGDYGTKTFFSKCKQNCLFDSLSEIFIPQEIIKTDYNWLWKLTWHNKEGYGAIYHKNSTEVDIVKTTDGATYSTVSHFNFNDTVSECRIRFTNSDEAIALLRSNSKGYIGKSKFPYTNWMWSPLENYLAGQDFLVKGDSIFCITRLLDKKKCHTVAYTMDFEGNIKKINYLPSGGDTSYAGIIEEKDFYLVSYYSMHENKKPSIYLANIPKSFL